jgi:hypothetical protein
MEKNQLHGTTYAAAGDNVSIRSGRGSQYGQPGIVSMYGAPPANEYAFEAPPYEISNRNSYYAAPNPQRMSMQAGYEPPMSNRGSTYGVMPPPGANFPSDEAIFQAVRQILNTADLMTVTKKQIRNELNHIFGVDLTAKKDFIHQCIDTVLQSQSA